MFAIYKKASILPCASLSEHIRGPIRPPDAIADGRTMNQSSTITITAEHSRGDTVSGNVPSDYAVLLPVLPTGKEARYSLLLHADTRGQPYRVEDATSRMP